MGSTSSVAYGIDLGFLEGFEIPKILQDFLPEVGEDPEDKNLCGEAFYYIGALEGYKRDSGKGLYEFLRESKYYQKLDFLFYGFSDCWESSGICLYTKAKFADSCDPTPLDTSFFHEDRSEDDKLLKEFCEAVGLVYAKPSYILFCDQF